eukprot:COSAG06_NODE_167_length_21546_cov_35.001352_23_plen_72_part_00
MLKGEPESLAGERWWTVEVATGGINPEEVAVDWAGKGVSDLKTALKERGLAEVRIRETIVLRFETFSCKAK